MILRFAVVFVTLSAALLWAAPASDSLGSVHAKASTQACASWRCIRSTWIRFTDSRWTRRKDGLLVAANCSSCHGSHGILSSKDAEEQDQSREHSGDLRDLPCGAAQAFSSGIHGQMLQAGVAEAPVCTSCHTAHQITKVGSAEWEMKTTATCGGCHKDELATYRDTFHAQVSALGYQQTARCWDCHGFHDILPASDPKSTVAPAQLIGTCGKCHAGANASFVKYDPHADSHDGALSGVALFGGIHESAAGERARILRAAYDPLVPSIAIRPRRGSGRIFSKIGGLNGQR
jgi:hypothetical protein